MMKKLSQQNIDRIKQKIELSENKILVRVNVTEDNIISGYDSHYNIYCVDKDYNIIWQVNGETTPFFDEGDCFISLKKNDKGEILTDRYSGCEYKIDPKTGESEYIGYHR